MNAGSEATRLDATPAGTPLSSRRAPRRPRRKKAGRVPLYAAREHIYQREIQGPWQRFRTVVLFVLAGFYVALPWVTWNGRQAVWFDVPSRKYYVFGVTFWPQDFIFLAGALMTGAFALFFFTNVAGRLWCGYACPQSVWTKFFMWMEWLVEGDRNQRILLDRQPWSVRKALRKGAKHGSWLVFSAVVGVTFVGYFLPIRDLVPRLGALDLTRGEWIFLAIASLLLYFDAGFMREQICRYACPYARFQGAMFDRSTLTIFYDRARGEPRGHRRKGEAATGLGDCVDCRLCVHVCPTGIDIRSGTQYECIGCTACIDACDAIMKEVGRAPGLIRYTSAAALAGEPQRLLRPRVVGYGAAVAAVAGALVAGLSNRIPVDVDVIRDRARLYREVGGGQIENVYTLKLMNKSQDAQTYRLATEPPFVLASDGEVSLPSGELKDVPVRVRAARGDLHAASTPVTFVVSATAGGEALLREEGRFLAPAPLHESERGEAGKETHE